MSSDTLSWNLATTCILSVAFTIEFGLMSAFSAGLIIYLRIQRRTACRDNTHATRRIILPPFEPILWMLCLISTCFFLFFIFVTTLEWSIWSNSIILEICIQGQQFGVLYLGIFLHQKSVTKQAILRTLFITISILSFPIMFTALSAFIKVPTKAAMFSFTSSLVVRSLICIFFMQMIVWPMNRASPFALREFCTFTLIYNILQFIAITMLNNYNEDGIYWMISSCAWMALAPFSLWRLLRSETQYWRGLGQRIVALRGLRLQSIQEIMSAKGLHSFIEMHRHDLIDFTNLDIQYCIGQGASAVVYRGTLYGKEPVAIKVYSPPDISESTVADFSREAAIWALLDHPNIIPFHGICVSPPTICLVTELCQWTLADYLHTNLNLSYVARLCYMLDVARAVDYLHCFTPPLIHRDIKPSNFLMDSENMLKLSDFGEARFTESSDGRRTMSVRGTGEYMAPEVVDGKQGLASYNAKADIYSLAITMWEIFHNSNQEKYPRGMKNHMQVIDMVLSGDRPPIQDILDPNLKTLLRDSWHQNPDMRPSAKEITQRLEILLDEACLPILQLLTQKSQSRNAIRMKGSNIISVLIKEKIAINEQEAIRIGNGLMDVGFLHENEHNASFLSGNTYIMDSVIQLGHSKTSVANSSWSITSMEQPSTNRCICKLYAHGMKRRKRRNSTMRTFKRRRVQEDNLLTEQLLSEYGWRDDTNEVIDAL